MRPPILSPDKFAAWFNSVVPGAYRHITSQDVRDMTECGLIGKYSYYGQSDLQTVRAILLYEQLRQERNEKLRLKEVPQTCKRCEKPLVSLSDSRRGRRKEYCPECEPFRERERYRKWRKNHARCKN